MKTIVHCLTAASILFLLACQPAASGLSEADKAAIAKTSEAFLKAMQERDWEALGATYTEDAVLMPPNMPSVKGRAAIKAHFGEFPEVSESTLETVEVAGCGDLAYVRGEYSLTISMDDGEPIVDTGKYIEIREKQADGSWLIKRDMYSSDVSMEH